MKDYEVVGYTVDVDGECYCVDCYAHPRDGGRGRGCAEADPIFAGADAASMTCGDCGEPLVEA